MKTFYLVPTNGRKSFYNKCKVVEDNSNISAKLVSYDTVVAEYNKQTETMTINNWYSNTTQNHINAFLSRYGFSELKKKDMVGGKIIKK